jgi:tetratricopeptide (TPR) repeat protein
MEPLEKTKEEWFELGLKYHDNGEYEKAVDAYRHVLKIDKYNPHAWHNLGLALRFLGNYDAAFKAFNKARSLDPGNGEIYMQQGLILIGQEKYTQAIKKFNKAFELVLKPKNQIDAFVGKGISLINLDDPDDAIVNFDAALIIDSENIQALTMKAGALLLRGDFLDAKNVIDEALTLDPEYNESLTILGVIESGLSNTDGNIEKK